MNRYINADSILRWWDNCNRIIHENKDKVLTGQTVIDYIKDRAEDCRQATIVMKSSYGECTYGTYDYNTPLEKAFVNELASRIREERYCETEVRVDDAQDS